MADAPERPAIVGAFVTRPRLVGSIVAGLATSLALTFFTELHASVAAMVGWDVLCLVFAGLSYRYMKNRDPKAMRYHAEEADEGRAVVLVLILLAAAASIGAIAVELIAAKGIKGPAQGLYIALAFFTVVMSWYVVHLNFALHYAHAYYSPSEEGKGDAGGLDFPGTRTPDYWDFLHFSIVIGVACQTADICFTDKGLRRLGTAHSVFAFAFNTVIVALTINLMAGLF